MTVENETLTLKKRFRGYFPVVIDVETAGFNSDTDALLEICAITLTMDEQGDLHPASTIHFHIEPFEGANLEKAALEFNGIIDPFSPLRGAVSEEHALKEIYKLVRKEQKDQGCSRAIMVAHNATFDHKFVMAASERSKLKRVPFHPFATFDTAALSGLAYGQTVLAKACKTAGMEFDNKEAHSALYDTEKTAELFCGIVNKWKALGGWPLVDNNN
ncbi:ribonuclease T [Vibrio genomosp. F10]|uniref:Ribonuclease T n=2 Tax=Vibrio genomosp. F10 TaxID=723171 RepID=A0A1B9R0N6_9VIBR|nr:ribonuclease T [Vibrio genomosp. F10]OCH77712.1 ribonuclease T [Vibrio genomosp. F10]OEE34262.1 ribonuclease T [Vibrio genomosp. F10 str. ZF-129]OEE94220.1 ribonuclease T [Vibrio genomosp. F10 str. 9ZC157]OEF00005.1 ribonuclease T [Vibrio genomosp. F10 str. 9ZD137]OEF09231.1 ribonuclease T [Vibrio genomosp. F10 str. 9ZB36]